MKRFYRRLCWWRWIHYSDYLIIVGSAFEIVDFQDKVTSQLDNGYEPIGVLIVSGDLLYQPMFLKHWSYDP